MHRYQAPYAIKTLTLFAAFVIFTLSGCQLFVKQTQPLESSKPATLTDRPYQRKDWPHWIDADRNCRNTRQELLITASQIPVRFKDVRQCTVKTGLWAGPYTGKSFTRASDVDIDHIVPLAHAHRHGAASWSRAQRRTFANDFDNLLVVDDATNQTKSDKAPHQWLPPDKRFWCEYGRLWAHVKQKYRLTVTQPERTALKQLAATCQ